LKLLFPNLPPPFPHFFFLLILFIDLVVFPPRLTFGLVFFLEKQSFRYPPS
jgi:hypothetical protein